MLRLAFSAAIIAGVALPAAAQQILTPDQLQPGCAPYMSGGGSSNGGSLVTVTFKNNRDVPVHAGWQNFEGNLALYHTIQPGSSAVQESYVGHGWVIIDSQFNCLMGTVLTSDNAVYEVN